MRLLVKCTFVIPVILAAFCHRAIGQDLSTGVVIRDERHYSNALGEPRNYRIFLPPDYDLDDTRRYPVIYFMHGWSQRYFGSINPNGDVDNDSIASFVSRHDVIVVKPDGYNRRPIEPYNRRPYNVGPVETFRQFPEYFPELIHHIDRKYRTIADRQHRAVSGLSMGGFMTMWLSGKYPHLVSAAGNFCGSPEFVVGPRDFPVEYRHLDMYNNYGGVNVRLHYGDKDFIRDYHRDMNAVWTQVIDNYSYKIFDDGHSSCGLAEMFSFFLETFRNPVPLPDQWSHTDVYPRFSVWDYEVSTDRTVEGFTSLENVDVKGFRIGVREFLPDGRELAFVNVTVTTPPFYEKNQSYEIVDHELSSGRTTRRSIRSDAEGRLVIHTGGAVREIGINRDARRPNVALTAFHVKGAPWATHKKDVGIVLRIVNKGDGTARNVTARITPVRSTSKVIDGNLSFGTVGAGEDATSKKPFTFRVDVDTLVIARFKATFQDADKNTWTQYLDIPLTPTVPELKRFVIADGRQLAVATSGNRIDTLVLGHGNGDGIPNPGELIVILAEEDGTLRRTDLTFSDPYLNPFGINERFSDSWTPFDHVGASAKYDAPLISSDCPANHTLNFIAEYWIPEYPLHHIRRGLVSIKVSGRDATPPKIKRIHATGDNVLQVTVIDGAPVTTVKATLVDEKDPNRVVTVTLEDKGTNGDRVASDLVFSQTIPDQVFGVFKVSVEAYDTFGNRGFAESNQTFVFH